MSSKTVDAVIAGYLGVDLTPKFDPARAWPLFSDLFRPGKLVETQGLHISLGGAVANTGLAMKKFGQKVELMGVIGCDPLGNLVSNHLQNEGVAKGIKRHLSRTTAYGIVIAPPGSDRMFFEDPGSNHSFSSDDICFDLVAQSRLFHFGYPPLMKKLWKNEGHELRTILQKVQSLGTTTSLDMALPDPDSPAGRADWSRILKNTLPFTDIFVPSIEEILFMLDPARYQRILSEAQGCDMVDVIPDSLYPEIGKQLIALGVKIAMIKAGPRGAFLCTGNIAPLNYQRSMSLNPSHWNYQQIWAAPYPRETQRIQNACGAGDCAIAGFLTAILKSNSLKESAQYAMIAGRDNLYGSDALSGLTSWNEMQQLIVNPRHSEGAIAKQATNRGKGTTNIFT